MHYCLFNRASCHNCNSGLLRQFSILKALPFELGPGFGCYNVIMLYVVIVFPYAIQFILPCSVLINVSIYLSKQGAVCAMQERITELQKQTLTCANKTHNSFS